MKYFLTTIGFFIAIHVSGQATYPFPQPGMVQGVTYVAPWTNNFEEKDVIYRYVKDTVICGKTYSRIEGSDYTTWYARYDNGKVWVGTCSAEVLRFDFSLNPGDTFQLPPGFPSGLAVVRSVSYVTLLNGQKRKYLSLQNTGGSNLWDYYDWVDGIGDIKQGFLYQRDFEGGHSRMICHSEASGMVYMADPDRCNSMVYGDSSLSVYLSSPKYCFSNNLSGRNAGDGRIELTVMGGTPAYAYTWSTGSTKEDPDSLPAGTYTVTVLDAASDTVIKSITLTEPSFSVNVGQSPVSACAMCDGSAYAQVSGAIFPVQYNWDTNPPQNTDTAKGLCSGRYDVVVSDANGDSACASVTVGQPYDIPLIMDKYNTYCNFYSGRAWVTASGGATPYSYLWNNGATTYEVTDVQAGDYCVTVTDSAGCFNTDCVTVVNNKGTTIGKMITNMDSAGTCSGSIEAQVYWGSPPYTYIWSTTPSQTTPKATGLCAGIYCITVEDGMACRAVACDTVHVINATGDFRKKGTLSIFPNPFSRSAVITLPGTSGTASLLLYDLSGRLVRREDNLHGSSFTLERGSLPPAMYFVEVRAEGEVWRGKVVAE